MNPEEVKLVPVGRQASAERVTSPRQPIKRRRKSIVEELERLRRDNEFLARRVRKLEREQEYLSGLLFQKEVNSSKRN